MWAAWAAAAVVAMGSGASAASKPHVLFLLIDDLGYADLGYHLPGNPEVVTPHINQLVATGVELDRHYVHKFCSPTRCAIQSGRAPIHVNVINAAPDVSNPADPVGGYAGIPRNMTGIAEIMARAGYATHFAGKWDAGMATNQHTPAGRGYSTSLSYFHHANDYYTQRDGGNCNGIPMTDLWNHKSVATGLYGRPALSYKNGPDCTVSNQTPGGGQPCVYEDQLFEERVSEVISGHTDHSTPLFVFWATHIVHGPLQVPDEQLAKFSFINDTQRRTYRAMVNYIDGAIGRIIQQTKDQHLYDDMIVIFSSDNGGPITGGATNYPLRGGKFANWEGGIRVNAFISGGFLPAAVQGTKLTELVAGWDWYATLAGLAGEDPTDHRAAKAGLPPIDSLDLWPLISGANKTSPRTRLEIGSNLGGDEANRTSGPTRVGGLIVPPYKILVGWGPGGVIDMATWSGPNSPNTSSGNRPSFTQVCGLTPATGCLYNVWDDPGEHINLAKKMPETFSTMLKQLQVITVYSPDRGQKDQAACAAATGPYKGYWGPFVDIN